MAKNPFWLRGARGKFAGSVVQKGENGTVVRENVKPRNPQTRAQMITRVIFGTLATAAYWLQKIVGQTFEKTENATKNKRAFVSQNFPILKQLAYLSENGDEGAVGAFDPKGQRTLVPNNYLVSNGSLVTPAFLKLFVDDGEIKGATNEIHLEDGTYTAAELWRRIFGLKAGQQLTLIQICTQNGADVAYDEVINGYDEGDIIMRFAEFNSLRLVLNEGEGSSIQIVEQTTKAQVVSVLDSLVNKEKTSKVIWDTDTDGGLIEFFTFVDADITFSINGFIAGLETNEFTTAAAGIIISEFIENSWHYNKCQLACIPSHYSVLPADKFADDKYGLPLENAIRSYMQSAGSTDSDLYTRQGGDDNSVNF